MTKTKWIGFAIIAALGISVYQNCAGFNPSVLISGDVNEASSAAFVSQPTSASVLSGLPYTLSINVKSTVTQVQWQFKPSANMAFSDISGATTADYVLTSVTDLTTGSYRVRATLNDGSTLYSSEAIITLRTNSMSCLPADLRMQWPLSGTQGVNWTISNYRDLDATTGLKDYTGATGANALTYDGHTGIDMPIGTMRAMDAGVNVMAIANGDVISVHDGEADRHVANEDTAVNNVVIQHDNGYKSSYLHLKNGSVTVRAGDRVTAGQKIAQVGSSGRSTNPHLHLEIVDCAGIYVDPMTSEILASKPQYQTPLMLMDIIVKPGKFTSVGEVASYAVANNPNIAIGSPLGIALFLSGGKSGDTILLEFIRPDGVTAFTFNNVANRPYGYSYPYYDGTMGLTGNWKLNIRLNGSVVKTVPITVN